MGTSSKVGFGVNDGSRWAGSALLSTILVYRSRQDSPIRVWLVALYQYGNFRCMKKTLRIDEVTLRDAKKACGAVTDTETVRLGLEALIRHSAYERLRKLRGSDADAKDVPRRRPETRKTRTAA
jgi:Bacterial antitoxin of type II TA system, VapB